MTTINVYLAGKMGGLTYDQANTWRESVTKFLAPEITCLSPMRGKSRETWVNGIQLPDLMQYHTDMIMTRDLNDIERSDAIIAKFALYEYPSVGTLIELGTAIPLRKPVVFIINKEDPLRLHPFIAEFPRSILTGDTSEAVSVVLSMFNIQKVRKS